MPTYEYECPKCRHRFEKFQEMSDKPLKTCPKCKSRKLRRLIGAGAGIMFKGSGFYKTDYRSESFKKDAQKEAGTSPAAPASGEKAKESKQTQETKATKVTKETKGGKAKPSSA